MASPERVSQHFSLHWDKCHQNLLSSFEKLLNSEHFVDVSLAVESEVIKCHKVVLSACSAYFEKILIDNPCQHPVVIMRGMKYWEVLSLVNFMYRGEVSVEEECLGALLKAAEALQIRGLAVTEGSEKNLHNNRVENDSDIKPKKMYYKPKNKKFRYNTEILNDEIEIKSYSDCSLDQILSKDKTDKKNISGDDVSNNTEDDKTKVESNISQKNILKEEIQMDCLNTGEVDTSLEYDNFEDDDLSSDGNTMNLHTSDPGPSHHFLDMDANLKENSKPDWSRKRKALNTGWSVRLTDTHFPVYIPSTLKKKNPTRSCHVCANSTRNPRRRRESRYMCSECKVTLCVAPCFQDFHTLLNY